MRSKATSSIIDRARGVTLVELVAVLTVLAIISVAAAIALRDPIRGFVDSSRRAELTDVADTALRRMGRDIRLALPNSVRVTTVGATSYMEMLLTKTGGRYRAQVDGSGNGDILDFTASAGDASFDTLAPVSALAGQAIVADDILVVHNLFGAPTVATSNAYTYNDAVFSCSAATPSSPNCNTARITGTGAGALANETRINFDARQFPLSSPGNRFRIVAHDGTVTYVCNPGAVDAAGNGTGNLTRVSGYDIRFLQPTGAYPGTPVTAVLAQYVSACTITYDPVVLTQGLGLVSIELKLTRGNETVTLYHEVHVSNVP